MNYSSTQFNPIMAQLRIPRFHQFRQLLNPLNRSQYLENSLHIPSQRTRDKASLVPSIFHSPISLSAQFGAKSIILDDASKDESKIKKPLHVLFKEAVGLSEKVEHVYAENEFGISELAKKLRKLEEEVRNMKENSGERETPHKLKKMPINDNGLSKSVSNKGLYSLFANNVAPSAEPEAVGNVGMEDPTVYKELSPEMVLFVTHLYEKGYFSNANFLPRNKFDVTCFENSYGRDFVKYASEKFAMDNREIAKWLSASDLKKVALFGCPSMGKKNIFSAKRLRRFFRIQEDTVCSKCVLKPSCKFADQSVWKGDNNNLDLAVVIRVITLYALESIPPQLVIPDEIKDSVNRLLEETVNLTQTSSTSLFQTYSGALKLDPC